MRHVNPEPAVERPVRAGRGWSRGTVLLALLFTACGPSAGPSASTNPALGSPSASVVASAGSGPATSASSASSPTPSVIHPTPTPSQAVRPTPTPFACTALPYNRSSGAVAVDVRDVRVGSHPGYDRIVFETAGTARPEVRIEVVKPPFKLDPSDLPVTIAGSSFIQIKLTGVAVETVPSAARDMVVNAPVLLELRQTAGYEGDATWIAGLSGRACSRISLLSGPTRLVVDVARTGS